MESKIVFLDIDGTLCLDDGTTVPQSAIEACRIARENNHKIFLCTGRSKPEIYEHITSLGFDGIIGAGGGFCEYANKEIFHKTFALDKIKEIVDYFEENKIPYYLESNEGLFSGAGCYEVIEKILCDELGLSKVHPFLNKLITNQESLYRKDVNKICFIENEVIKFEDIEEKFSLDFNIIDTSIPTMSKKFGEISDKKIDKSKTIAYLLNYIGADIKDTIAIGDGMNDIGMIKNCKIGIAMGNGVQALKEVADYVCKRNDEDGLYDVFKNYLRLI